MNTNRIEYKPGFLLEQSIFFFFGLPKYEIANVLLTLILNFWYWSLLFPVCDDIHEQQQQQHIYL